MKKLPIEFYDRADVVQIARELIGKLLVTKLDGQFTSGRIVECEAYVGITDMASHSRNGTRTPRNEHMYAEPGTSYVYICYGMHHLFNLVTNKKDIPDAILIRALEPLEGIAAMLKRTGKPTADFTLTKGPGNAGRAMGFSKEHSGLKLTGHSVFLADDGTRYDQNQIGSSPRIGVESAGKDALLPYRFFLKGNRHVSGRPWR